MVSILNSLVGKTVKAIFNEGANEILIQFTDMTVFTLGHDEAGWHYDIQVDNKTLIEQLTVDLSIAQFQSMISWHINDKHELCPANIRVWRSKQNLPEVKTFK